MVFGDASGTLLHAISSVPWWHRVCALGGAGLIGGISWYLYARAGGKPVSLPKAVNGQKMPILLTFWHSINQIVIVGMGASIGREVAPREISASLGGKIADFLYLPPEQRRIIVGCAAGAGLAAVYSLPLSGAVFALEILLIEVTASAVWPALIISGGAVLVAHGWVRSDPFYTLPEAGQLLPTASLTLWAVIIGPLLGIIGVLFKSAVSACSAARPTGWRLLAWMIPIFTLIGVITVWVPSIAGNGQSTAQLAFDGAVLGQGGNRSRFTHLSCDRRIHQTYWHTCHYPLGCMGWNSYPRSCTRRIERCNSGDSLVLHLPRRHNCNCLFRLHRCRGRPWNVDERTADRAVLGY